MARKVASTACAVVLAAGLVPAPALAEGLAATPLDAAGASQAQQRAEAIDALPDGAYDDESIIVVYREGASETKQAERGVHEMTVESVDDATAAEVLSDDAGAPGAGAALKVELPGGTTVGEAVAAAEEDPDVLYAQPNFRYYLLDELADDRPAAVRVADAVEEAAAGLSAAAAPASDSSLSYELPNDPYVSVRDNDTADYPSTPNQWWIHSVNAPAAWQRVKGEDNPCAVAVLDTGIDFTHDDLKANILTDYAYDSYLKRKLDPARDSIDDDEMQHGCHVAGIIAAEANNGRGIAGVSYNGKVLPIRVFHQAEGSHGAGKATCSDDDLIRAYEYLLSDDDGNGRSVAKETNTHVVNMSLGGYLKDESDYYGGDPMDYYDYAFEDIIQKAQEEADILTVAAAGNGANGYARTDASYPSDYADVMGVMALKTDTTHTRWSDYNENKNISAPGNNIFSTYWSATEGSAFNGTKYAFESGTSMATPLVAGCASLLWSYDPNMSVQDVKDAIYDTAVPLSSDSASRYGHGRIDVAAALASLGTANIKSSASTMMRTDVQRLSASEIADPSTAHSWTWQVTERGADTAGNAVDVPTDKATITQDGVLTALEAGKVTVTATAKDNSKIAGHRTIAITEIEIPDGITASPNPSESTIAVRWDPSSAAKRYRIERATDGVDEETPGAFSEVATVKAQDVTSASTDEDGNEVQVACYLDPNKSASAPNGVEVGVLYWYRVTPIGEYTTTKTVDGEKVTETVEVEGKTTPMSSRCFFTDKRALKSNIQRAENLMNTTSVSDSGGSDVLASAYWVTSSQRKKLRTAMISASNTYTDSTILQSGVDSSAGALEAANDEFEAARAAGTKPLAANRVSISLLKQSVAATCGTRATFAASALYRASGQGAITYVKVGGDARIGFSNGTITVPATMPAGRWPVTVRAAASGNASYAAGTSGNVTVTVVVGKLANTMKASAKKAVVKAKDLKKGAKTLAASKAIATSGAQGGLTYSKVGKSKLSIAKNGQVTVPKKLKKGTYKLTVKVTAAGDATHEATSKQVVVKVQVK